MNLLPNYQSSEIWNFCKKYLCLMTNYCCQLDPSLIMWIPMIRSKQVLIICWQKVHLKCVSLTLSNVLVIYWLRFCLFFSVSITTSPNTLFLWNHGYERNLDKFTIDIKLNYQDDLFHYIPGFWCTMKWAWIQYLSIYIVFYWIIQKIRCFVFHNQITSSMVFTEIKSHGDWMTLHIQFKQLNVNPVQFIQKYLQYLNAILTFSFRESIFWSWLLSEKIIIFIKNLLKTIYLLLIYTYW